MTASEFRNNADTFTKAYMEAAIWSSSCDPFGTCPDCGKQKQILCRWNPRRECVCQNCSDREPDYEPEMDRNYDIEDFAPGTLDKMAADCRELQKQQIDWLGWDHLTSLRYGTMELAGHDFWLTRNGHGSGFWDGGWKEPAATKLTKAAKAFGECNLYVGDDGLIYC